MPATAEPETGSRRRALLVATGDYADRGLAALRAPTGDVDALAAVLADGSIGEFDVTRLVDRSTENLKMEIEGFFGDAKRDDLLLLYFSCHGVLSQSRRFYFATSTTALNLLRATAIEDSFVNDVMQHSRARSIVLILDCCHSGAFGRGLAPKSALTVDVEHRFEGRGRVTLSASTALEYAFEEANPATGINELEPAAPGSLFTRCLVEGLATGDADMDGDGHVSVDELYDYVCQRMREDVTHQTPGMAGDVRGEIVIARSPRRRGLPPELHQAVDSRLAGVREGAVTELAALLGSAEPGVGEAARAALERLAGDDSQRVSSRAREVLGRRAAPPAEERPLREPPPPDEPPTTVLQRPSRRRAVVAAAVVAVAAIGAAIVLFTGGRYSGPAIAYDFDGDGTQEIAFGGPGIDGVLIHPGPGSDDITTISANELGGRAASITSADFDGDGHVDLAVGISAQNVVNVLYGTADGISSSRRKRFEGDEESRFGANVLGRDFDDDGHADLVIGAPGKGAGTVEIIFGSDEGFGRSTDLERPPGDDISAFGSRLRSGDIDGDGDVDLVEGAPDPEEGPTAGHLSYCAGAPDGPTSCTTLPQIDADCGSSALAVADLNADGRDDIVQADAELPSESGGLRLWFGVEGGPPTTAEVVTPDDLELSDDLSGLDSGFGASVDAGPIDEDEYPDIVVGAPGHDNGAGAVVFIRGAPEKGYTRNGRRLLYSDDSAPGDELGSNLAMLRLEGPDARPDVAVAAKGAEFETAVLVFRGGEFETLPDLGKAKGSPKSLRLGRTPGA